jgi:hypothetical protein
MGLMDKDSHALNMYVEIWPLGISTSLYIFLAKVY